MHHNLRVFVSEIKKKQLKYVVWDHGHLHICCSTRSLNGSFALQTHEGVLYKMWIPDHDHAGDGEEKTPRGMFLCCVEMIEFNIYRFIDRFLFLFQIIEKRRRDRINSSLSELRRLVPTAFEKQVKSDGLASDGCSDVLIG